MVALLDFLKGLLPVVFAKAAGFDAAWVAAAAVAAVAGHCWSPFIGFKGGKAWPPAPEPQSRSSLRSS